MKIVINKSYGGFNLSNRAIARYAELTNRPPLTWFKRNFYDFKTDSQGNRISGAGFNYLRVTQEEAFSPENNNDSHSFYACDELVEAEHFEQLLRNNNFQNHVLWNDEIGRHENRNNPLLVQVVEELGTEVASGSCSELKVVEIPDDVQWIIEEYDGNEWVSEVHRRWY
jgi:hypothetical protein